MLTLIRKVLSCEMPKAWKVLSCESRRLELNLCELKSRRSPKRSPFVRKAEGMESSIMHNAEGILIYLKNIVLSSKNDAGIAGV